jgi:hypothetical protein
LEKGFVQAQEGFLGRSAEEELEEFLVKLELLTEGKLEQSLVGFVGDRPKGPLKQWGNPHLNPCFEIS